MPSDCSIPLVRGACPWQLECAVERGVLCNFWINHVPRAPSCNGCCKALALITSCQLAMSQDKHNILTKSVLIQFK